MKKRIVTISCNPRPINYSDENQVWIQVDDKLKTADYIRAGIRMAPDELRIEKELIGFFRI